MINERIVIYVEEGCFIAQCLEHDICVQALNMDDLFARLARTFWLERENMANIGPAPQSVLDKWPERAQIASLTAENERLLQENYRLRARLQILTGVAVENTTLDALQPKEGK